MDKEMELDILCGWSAGIAFVQRFLTSKQYGKKFSVFYAHSNEWI